MKTDAAVRGILKFVVYVMLLGVLYYFNFRPPEQSIMLWWILFVLVLIFMGQKE